MQHNHGQGTGENLMIAAEFERLTGAPPEDGDLERVNCHKAGQAGHFYCGVCSVCGLPRFMCSGNEKNQVRRVVIPTNGPEGSGSSEYTSKSIHRTNGVLGYNISPGTSHYG